MRDYTESELRDKGYQEVRLTNRSYLGKDYEDGRQIIFKRLSNSSSYLPHGARDAGLNPYDSDELEDFEDDLDTLEDLEEFLLNPTVLT